MTGSRASALVEICRASIVEEPDATKCMGTGVVGVAFRVAIGGMTAPALRWPEIVEALSRVMEGGEGVSRVAARWNPMLGACPLMCGPRVSLFSHSAKMLCSTSTSKSSRADVDRALMAGRRTQGVLI